MIKQSDIAKLLKKELDKDKQKDEVSLSDLQIFLEQYNGVDRIIRSDEIALHVKEKGVRVGMQSGMDDMDAITGGFFEEQVVVVTAYPKSGKTAFCLHLIESMKSYHPTFLAIEQSPYELIEQLTMHNRSIPLFYAPESTEGIDRTTDWVHLKIVEAQFRANKDFSEPSKMVFIDHFGYIARPKTSDQATWEIIRLMQELKSIAKQTKTCIVVIVHTTKPDETEPPTTKDLFGSAGYHQEADLVLSLWRETYKEDKKTMKTNNVLLQVLANRRTGDTGYVKFTFDNGQFVRRNWLGVREQKSENELADLANAIEIK